ncbi:TetR/AcrR family transcriptional regulator [Microbacterium sp. ZW T5_56]|uniref:TetR/AcrR family transcriptional regulator n=1 Tax=Microbacterium sp. ZW T5_56 TaxID=3378081 RepID=UPI003852E406
MVADTRRRARAGRPAAVGQDAMIEAATVLADEGGLEAVTFRALADRLGVSAMAVHRASGGIDALRHRLIARVVDEAVATLDWTDPDWRPRLEMFALGLRDLLMRHPLVLEAHRRASLDTPDADDVAHRIVASLRDAGLDEERAVYAYAAVHDFVTGHAAIRLGRGDEELDDIPASRRTASVFEHHHDPERRFRIGLDLLLDGIAQRVTGERA